LKFARYEVREAADGTVGLRQALELDYDLLLLDLVLPGQDGFAILSQVRHLRPQVPIIILSARGEEDVRVRGLREGADDYVVKPFSVKELLARVAAVMRRTAERPAEIKEIKIPGGRISLDRREVGFDDGCRCKLSEREAELVYYLASNGGRAVAREEILANVWRIRPEGITTRTIDMHIARLREKLEQNAGEPAVILTVRGKGYMFQATV
jgi:DNA-binding response OmpR family regulator